MKKFWKAIGIITGLLTIAAGVFVMISFSGMEPYLSGKPADFYEYLYQSASFSAYNSMIIVQVLSFGLGLLLISLGLGEVCFFALKNTLRPDMKNKAEKKAEKADKKAEKAELKAEKAAAKAEKKAGKASAEAENAVPENEQEKSELSEAASSVNNDGKKTGFRSRTGNKPLLMFAEDEDAAAEPADAEPAEPKAEPAKAEPVEQQAEPKADPENAEAVEQQAEPANTEAAEPKAEPADAEPVKAQEPEKKTENTLSRTEDILARARAIEKELDEALRASGRAGTR